MERRWDKVWPLWVPKTFTVKKPTSEYLREWATLTPDRWNAHLRGTSK